MTLSAPWRREGFGNLWITGIFALIVSTGCKHKPAIQAGSEVKLNYTLTVDGQVVDSSRPGEPLSFVAGAGQIIPGLDEQIKGLTAGDHRSITVAPEKGYGPVHAEAIQKVPRKNFKNAGEIKVGTTVTAQNNGRLLQARVTAVDKNEITVDMNHPMAGKTLNFDIEVVNVSDGKKGEKSEQGEPGGKGS